MRTERGLNANTELELLLRDQSGIRRNSSKQTPSGEISGEQAQRFHLIEQPYLKP
jgi:hypothetical protein